MPNNENSVSAALDALTGLLKAAQDHYIQMYMPPKAEE